MRCVLPDNQDLNYHTPSDKDLQDMIVKVSAPGDNPTNTSVPDGGMTIMLLGGALVGLETLRRKSARSVFLPGTSEGPEQSGPFFRVWVIVR